MAAPSCCDALQRLAGYNTLANRRLYDACARLDTAILSAPRPVFFGSILATLNHLVTGDRIWLTRFRGGTASSDDLGAIHTADLRQLSAIRMQLDADIELFFARLDPAWLTGEIVYINNAGQEMRDERLSLALHLFNHQTHHRGQVHACLSATPVAPPSLDLHRLLNP